MRSYLVLDASPDLVGVNKRQRGLAAAGPSAQQQAGFVPHGVAGTLSVGMLAEVGLEIVLENGLQRLANFILSKRSFDSIDARHPRAKDSVGEASVSILIFRAFAFQEFLHFAAAFIDVSDHGGEGSVAQLQVLHLLLEILAVEELLFHEARTTMGQIAVMHGFFGLANSASHLRQGREGSKVNAGAHAVRSPEFNVVSIVMGLKEASPMI